MLLKPGGTVNKAQFLIWLEKNIKEKDHSA